MKINVKDIAKVITAVDKVENGCTARLFNPFSFASKIRNAETKLWELSIPKKLRRGITLRFIPEGVPNSYKYSAQGTYVYVEYFSTGWFVVGVERSECQGMSYGCSVHAEIILTDEAHAALAKRYAV